MTDCPKCGHDLKLVRAEIAQVGALLEHSCKAVLIVTKSGPSPSPDDFAVRLAAEEEKIAWRAR